MEKKSENAKKPYQRPVVDRVVLMPMEMALGACKNPGGGPCSAPPKEGGKLPGS